MALAEGSLYQVPGINHPDDAYIARLVLRRFMEWVRGVHGGGEGDGEVRTIPEGGIFRVGVPHVQACTLVAGGGPVLTPPAPAWEGCAILFL